MSTFLFVFVSELPCTEAFIKKKKFNQVGIALNYLFAIFNNADLKKINDNADSTLVTHLKPY